MMVQQRSQKSGRGRERLEEEEEMLLHNWRLEEVVEEEQHSPMLQEMQELEQKVDIQLEVGLDHLGKLLSMQCNCEGIADQIGTTE